MKSLIKSYLTRYTPVLADAIIAYKRRRYFRKRFKSFQDTVQAKVYGEGEIKVLTGPFVGMRYFNEVVWGCITINWIGSYESELSPIVEQACLDNYNTFINVGCADGYYAVGLAWKCPSAKVYAFDLDPFACKQCLRLAKLNQATRNLTVSKICNHEVLEHTIYDKTFIVCDIEGAERELLDPAKAPKLLYCDLLVEIHEDTPGSQDLELLLRSRFKETHSITRIDETERKASDYKVLLKGKLSPKQVHQAIQEGREIPQSWLWLKRR